VTSVPELEPPQLAVIEALLRGATREQAARAGDMSERSVYRLLADPVFSGELLRQRARLVSGVATQLAVAAPAAVHALRDMVSGAAPATLGRVAAAKALLHALVTVDNHADVLRRVEALEQQAAQAKRRRRQPWQ